MDTEKGTRVALETLGCKLNQAESDSLARQLLQAGYHLTDGVVEADIYILNTCTVTHVADRKARHLLHLARRRHPHALVIATGCYAQRAPQELEGVADVVIPQAEKPYIAERLARWHQPSPAPGQGQPERTRALVKIQDGCQASCSYCIVPQVRGSERSLPPQEIVAQVKALSARGYREVVLTGTRPGGYGWDGTDLAGLVAQILAQTPVERLRLSSLQPQELSPQLISLWADSRLCPHFHLPLQSGSDAVLASMRRRYSTQGFRRAVRLIREAIPQAAITTDIMVGFPGESAKEFEDSLGFCREAGFAALHVFPYSPRPGTTAAQMEGQPDARTRRERTLRMLRLSEEQARSYRQRLVGQTLTVLWENEVGPGVWSGLTENYLRVLARSREDLANRLLPARLLAVDGKAIWGEIVPANKG